MSIAIGSQPAKLYLGDVLLTGSSGWVADESTMLNIVNDIGVVGISGIAWENLSAPFTMEICKEIDAEYSRSDGAIFVVRANNYYGIGIDGTANNEIIIRNGTGYASSYNNTGESFPSGAIHTISCVFGSESNTLYLDGELLGTYTPTVAANNPITQMYFNRDSSTSHTVAGTAYAYRLYNRALTANEIKQNYVQDVAVFGGDV